MLQRRFFQGSAWISSVVQQNPFFCTVLLLLSNYCISQSMQRLDLAMRSRTAEWTWPLFDVSLRLWFEIKVEGACDEQVFVMQLPEICIYFPDRSCSIGGEKLSGWNLLSSVHVNKKKQLVPLQGVSPQFFLSTFVCKTLSSEPWLLHFSDVKMFQMDARFPAVFFML